MGDVIETIHYRKDGSIVSRRELPLDLGFWHNLLVRLHLRHNTMTVGGFASIISYMSGISSPATPFTYIGIGTGTTPSAVGDTQLQSPLVIKAATMSMTTTLNANDTLQAVYTFSSGDGLSGTTVAVTEVVLANGSVNGSALIALHQVYTPADTMNWNQGDLLQVTVKMQAKQG
jgi:hypothetical protein